MHDQYGVDRNLVEAREGGNGLTTAIHVSAWDQESNITVVDNYFRAVTVKFCFVLEISVPRFCELPNEVGPNIVTRPIIVWAGVSQPYDYFNGRIQC